MSTRAQLPFDLLLVTPALEPKTLLRAAARALEHTQPERIAIVVRAPDLAPADRSLLLDQLRALTRKRGALLLCHARLAEVRTHRTDGIQLPEAGPSVAEARALLGPVAFVGASRHDLPGLERAASEGASFATLSPVWPTGDKTDALLAPGFGELARAVTLPVFALGGVAAHNAEAAIRHGAHGVAVMRAVLQADEPARAAADLLAAVDRGRRARPVR